MIDGLNIFFTKRLFFDNSIHLRAIDEIKFLIREKKFIGLNKWGDIRKVKMKNSYL